MASNMLFTFVIGQCFTTMLCSMRYGVFLFFAGMAFVASCIRCMSPSAMLDHKPCQSHHVAEGVASLMADQD